MQDIINGTRALSPSAQTEDEPSEEGEGSARVVEEEEENKEEDTDISMQTTEVLRKDKRLAKGKEKRKSSNDEKAPLQKEASICQNPATIYSPSPQKRRGYTTKQEEIIAEYFSQHISQKTFPTSLECRDFLQLYPMPGKGHL